MDSPGDGGDPFEVVSEDAGSGGGGGWRENESVEKGERREKRARRRKKKGETRNSRVLASGGLHRRQLVDLRIKHLLRLLRHVQLRRCLPELGDHVLLLTRSIRPQLLLDHPHLLMQDHLLLPLFHRAPHVLRDSLLDLDRPNILPQQPNDSDESLLEIDRVDDGLEFLGGSGFADGSHHVDGEVRFGFGEGGVEGHGGSDSKDGFVVGRGHADEFLEESDGGLVAELEGVVGEGGGFGEEMGDIGDGDGVGLEELEGGGGFDG